jgi:hypothetical protein
MPLPECRWTTARARRRELRRRRPGRVQHGRHGAAPGAARQRRLCCTARCQRGRCSRACGRVRSGDVPITSVTNGVHAPTWTDRELIDRRPSGSAIDGTRRLGGISETHRRPAVGGQAHPAPAARRHDARPGCGRRGSTVAPARPSSGGPTTDPRPRRPDDRVRPARADLQAAHPDAARPGAAQGAAHRPRAPVQLVIAGKSHPADDGGKRLIQQLVQFADDPEVRHRIVFLPNYDIGMASTLYPGCDVWLNNPLRPFEACGTSGMKAALNGGLNLSILDGWWDEWYDGENGWAIPTADGVDDPTAATTSRPRRCTRSSSRRSPRRSTPVTSADCRSAGSRWSSTRCDPRPEGARQPHAARVRHGALRAGRSCRVVARWAEVQRRARARGIQGEGPGGPGRRCGSSTSSPRASRTRRRSVTTLTVRAYVDLGTLRADEVRVQTRLWRIVGPGRHDQGARRSSSSSTPRATRATGISSPVTVTLTQHRARSVTPSGSCPSTRAWWLPASSVWSPTPDRGRANASDVRRPRGIPPAGYAARPRR